MAAMYGAVTLESFSLSCSLITDSLYGSVSLEALTSAGELTWLDADLSLENIEVSGTFLGGWALRGDVTLAPLTSEGVAHPENLFSASLSLGPLSASGYFGDRGNVTIEALSASGTILAGEMLSGAVTLRRLLSSGEIGDSKEYTGNLALEPLVVAGALSSESLLVGSAVLRRLALAANLYSGNVVSGTITLPVFESDGVLHGEFVGYGAVVIPTLQVYGTFAVPVSALASGYDGLAINLNSKALSRYDGQPFNSMALFNDVYLAASPAGIYALTGDDDAASAINAVVRSGLVDFGTNQLKRIRVAYISYRTDGDLELKVTTDEGESHTYKIGRIDGDGIHQNKVKIGRGMVGRHFQWEITNKEGCDFEIHDLTVFPQVLRRKFG
jgi:hypothetical protein